MVADGIPVCDGPDTNPRKPRLKAPPGAIDCHAHIFGPVAKYPFSPKRLFTPPDVTVAQYRQLLATLGIERAVLVTPSVYGMDNERQLDTLVEMKGAWRGVAVVATDVAEAELDRLHRAGFRGVRVNLFAKSGLVLDDLEAIAARVSAFKWHVQLHADARTLPEIAARLRQLPVDVVFDHMGHIPAATGVAHPGFAAMLDLMREGRLPWETATIHTVVTNTLTDKATKPQVNAFISHEVEPRLIVETLELAPLESRALQWEVDKADIVFERVILVNILQRPYRDLPSRQGACTILVYSLFGLTGGNTLIFLVSIGVVAIILGAAMLYIQFRPFADPTKSFVQLLGVFLSLILLGLFAALTRRWGLTLVLDAGALLAITTGSVEIYFKRK